MRAVQGRAVIVRTTLASDDGVPHDADASVAVSVTDDAGNVVASGDAASVVGSTGKYTFTFTPAAGSLAALTATFTAAVSGSAVVWSEDIIVQDRRIVPLNLVRALDGLDATALPADDFLRLVDQAEDAFARALQFPPVVQGASVHVQTFDTDRLTFPGIFTPQTVISLTYKVGSYVHVFDSTELAKLHCRDGAIEFQPDTFPFGTSFPDFLFGSTRSLAMFRAGLYEAEITHGMAETPRDLARAFLTYCRYLGQSSDWPMRAKRVLSEQSDIWLSMSNPDSAPTGIPEVDGVLLAYAVQSPVAGLWV